MFKKNQQHPMLFMVISVSILVMVTGIDAASAPQQTWGLCIGISQYMDDNIPDLKWANKDAIDFCTAFLEYKLNIPREHYFILQDSSATQRNINNELSGLRNRVPQGDRIYIFYSGHGAEDFPIVPHDARLDDEKNFFSIETIQRILRNIGAREIIFIADACYSGRLVGATILSHIGLEALTGLNRESIVKMAQTDMETETRISESGIQSVGTVVMTSANGIQPSVELPYLMNGRFTYHLMDTLMNKNQEIDNGDGTLNLHEVYQYVRKTVIDRTTHFIITGSSLKQLKTKLPGDVLEDLRLHLQDVKFTDHEEFSKNVKTVIGIKKFDKYYSLIEECAKKWGQEPQISDKEKAEQIVLFEISQPIAIATPNPMISPEIYVVNIDESVSDTEFTISSSIEVTWNQPEKMVVQAYKAGNPIPIYNQESSSGVIQELDPGKFEIKLWQIGAGEPYKHVWVTRTCEGVQMPVTQEQYSILNIDETEQFAYPPLSSPLQVTWNNPKAMEMQIYRDETLKYREIHCSGTILTLEPGVVEIKLWEPGESLPYKSVWVEIVSTKNIVDFRNPPPENSVDSPLTLQSPVTVIWNPQEGPMEIHIYKNYEQIPIYQKVHSSGNNHIELEPGQVEVKIWIQGQARSIWVEIVEN